MHQEIIVVFVGGAELLTTRAERELHVTGQRPPTAR